MEKKSSVLFRAMIRKQLVYGLLLHLPFFIHAEEGFNKTLSDCIEFDLQQIEAYSSNFDTDVSQVLDSNESDEYQPFGMSRSDWTRLKLLRDSLTENSVLKGKFNHVVRLLFVAHQETSKFNIPALKNESYEKNVSTPFMESEIEKNESFITSDAEETTEFRYAETTLKMSNLTVNPDDNFLKTNESETEEIIFNSTSETPFETTLKMSNSTIKQDNYFLQLNEGKIEETMFNFTSKTPFESTSKVSSTESNQNENVSELYIEPERKMDRKFSTTERYSSMLPIIESEVVESKNSVRTENETLKTFLNGNENFLKLSLNIETLKDESLTILNSTAKFTKDVDMIRGVRKENVILEKNSSTTPFNNITKKQSSTNQREFKRGQEQNVNVSEIIERNISSNTEKSIEKFPDLRTSSTTSSNFEKNPLHYSSSIRNKISHRYKHKVADVSARNLGDKGHIVYELDTKNKSIWRQEINRKSSYAMYAAKPIRRFWRL